MQLPLRRTLAALLAASALLAACGDDDDTTAASGDAAGETAADGTSGDADGETRDFELPDGEVVAIPAEPRSVVACGYAVLPLIQADAALSAVCEWGRELDNMDDETLAAYEALDKIGPDGDVSAIDYEGIAAAQPDLIIMGVPARVKEMVDLERLESLAPVLFLGPQDPGDWRDLSLQYADAAGVSEAYEATQAAYDDRAAEIRDAYAEQFDGMVFAGLCTPCGTDGGELTREYESSYVTNLFDDLGLDFGGSSDDPDGLGHAEFTSVEQLVEAFGDADVIVYGVDADGSVPADVEALLSSASWQALPAVQAGRVIEVRHHSAATFETALAALDSIESGLAELAEG